MIFIFDFYIKNKFYIVEYIYNMSITRQNLSVVIVSYKSEHVIENCINSIGSEIEIIIIENSNNMI